MQKGLYAVAMIAAILTGHQSRALAQGKPAEVTATVASYAGRQLICLNQWDVIKSTPNEKLKPEQAELKKYGRSYFVSACNKSLCAANPGVARCRAN